MSYTVEELYELLPAVYRLRDAEQGGVLKALVAAMASQAVLVEEDIERLYENLFIETCDDWVVPYIGDLVGARALNTISSKFFSMRSYVANTLALRRRKGTLAVVEQVAADVTDWPVRAVEYFTLLGATQYMKHPRPAAGQIADLRGAGALELEGGPFDSTAHTVEVRRIEPGRGKYNLPDIGLFFWRLESFPVVRGSARAAQEKWQYRFHPAGLDSPLFNPGATEQGVAHLAAESDVPGPLRPRPLYEETEALRRPPAGGAPRVWFPSAAPVFEIAYATAADEPLVPIDPARVLICGLQDWWRPPQQKRYPDDVKPLTVAVDVRLGRIAFAAGVEPVRVEVNYSYGFSAAIGGGPYDRSASRGLQAPPEGAWTHDVEGGADELAKAISAWNAPPRKPYGVITIRDSRTYLMPGAEQIEIPERTALTIVAADGQRPHIAGSLSVKGSAPADSSDPGTLLLDGLFIEGPVAIAAGNLGSLDLLHSTVLPKAGTVTVAAGNARLEVTLDGSVCGAVALSDAVPKCSVRDSIIDPAPGDVAIRADGAAVDIEASTILGGVRALTAEASNSIMTGALIAARRQTGCVRFCYLPTSSRSPRRYRCQPDLGIRSLRRFPWRTLQRAQLAPMFTSLVYGQPGYAQLHRDCPESIREGGEDGSEMGAFFSLKQPQRIANVRAAVEEYMRLGREAGVFFAT